MNLGDIIITNVPLHPDWNGQARVSKIHDSRSVTAVMLDGPNKGRDGWFYIEQYTSVISATVEGLTSLVESLRNQGYTISVEVTPPTPDTITI